MKKAKRRATEYLRFRWACARFAARVLETLDAVKSEPEGFIRWAMREMIKGVQTETEAISAPR